MKQKTVSEKVFYAATFENLNRKVEAFKRNHLIQIVDYMVIPSWPVSDPSRKFKGILTFEE